MTDSNKKISWRRIDQAEYLTLLANPRKRYLVTLSKILLPFILLCGFLFLFGIIWIKKHFSDVTLDMMILQLRMPLQGTGGKYFYSFILQALLPGLGSTIVILIIGRLIRRQEHALYAGSLALFPNRGLSMILAVIFTAVSFGQAGTAVKLPQYLASRSVRSDFIRQHYITPTADHLIFPDQKRNLIYIYLESMESSFLSTNQGGLMNQDIMPELYDIARNHISFSDQERVGGAVPLPGMGVTSAGMVAQTAGIPLFLPADWKGEDAREIFIRSTVTLGDILAEQGYEQYLMVGSDAAFGARDQYYTAHGNAHILDLASARESGVIAPDYDNHFWGMEDQHLYEYAKQELRTIARQEKPFAFTMLTSDTHFPDGYVCDLCREEFGDQYSDVLACASRQAEDFILWLQEQDFYENTTIIITGDHLSMNTDYFHRNHLDINQRRVYNAFINSAGAAPVQTKNRMFASIDMFPTTLASLGVEIKGDRLGLGTNLFSDKPTLLEMYGYDFINAELSREPEHYNDTFNQ